MQACQRVAVVGSPLHENPETDQQSVARSVKPWRDNVRMVAAHGRQPQYARRTRREPGGDAVGPHREGRPLGMVPAKLFPHSAGVRLEVLAVGQDKRLASDGVATLPIAVPSGVEKHRQSRVARGADGAHADDGNRASARGSGQRRVGNIETAVGSGAAERVAHIHSPLRSRTVVPTDGEPLVAVGRQTQCVEGVTAGDGRKAQVVDGRRGVMARGIGIAVGREHQQQVVARRGHSEPLRMVGPAALPGQEVAALRVRKAYPAVGNPVIGGVGNAVAEEKGCVQLGIHRRQHHPNMVEVGVNAGIVMTVALPVVIHTVVAAVGKMEGVHSPMETAVPYCSVIAVGGAAVAAHIHAAASV